MKEEALIIFVKNIIIGHVKTRLAATLGNDAAVDIYNQLLKNIHDKIKSLGVHKIVFYSDFLKDDIWETDSFEKTIQVGNNLGERMENAFKRLINDGYKKTLIIGTDCPQINKDILREAFEILNNYDVVIGPATDGGYYLIGMKNEYPCLFKNIEWSTEKVLKQTIDICIDNKLSYYLLPELSDIDEKKDLNHFEDLIMPKDKLND